MEEIIMAIKLQAEKRVDLKQSATKKIREKGFIPSVVYGRSTRPMTISVEGIELLKTVRDEGRNAILTLDVEGDEPRDVMLLDYQTDHVSKEIHNIDYYIINLTEEIDVDITVYLLVRTVRL